MNPEILRNEIAEVNHKIAIYSATLDSLKLKKEKLIVLLYEEENLNKSSLSLIETTVENLNHHGQLTDLPTRVQCASVPFF